MAMQLHRGALAVLVAAAVLIGIWASLRAASAQDGFVCPPPSVRNGVYCVCPDGSLAGMSGCPMSVPRPPEQDEWPVKCGSYSCRAGAYCGSRNTCITIGDVDCGNGTACRGGQRCSRDGRHCLSQNDIECGSRICSHGATCGSGDQCLAKGDVDCGSGRSCPAGHTCRNGGISCVSPQELAQERKRRDELARKDLEQRRLKDTEQQRAATLKSQQNCTLSKIEAIARGQNPDATACGPGVTGQGTSSSTPQADRQWQEQLQALRRNAVTLHPEQRKFGDPPVVTSLPPAHCSTFSGAAGCPTADEVARATQARRDEQEKLEALQARAAQQDAARRQQEEEKRQEERKKEEAAAAERAKRTRVTQCTNVVESCGSKQFAMPDSTDGRPQMPGGWFNSIACEVCSQLVTTTCTQLPLINRWWCSPSSGPKACRTVNRPLDYVVPDASCM